MLINYVREYNSKNTVQVYRNLHKKCYSIRQNRLVVAYADELILAGATLKVSEKGRQRVLKEKRKNVHAYVEGYIMPTIREYTFNKLYYNPYHTDSFIDFDSKEPIYKASYVKCLSDMTLLYTA